MADAITNPFILLHNALWALLEAHQGFTDLVSVGNRVKFTGNDRSPIKPEVSEADLPEVRIVPAGGSAHLGRTSSSTSVVKRFEIQVSTGDQRVDYKLYDVEWEVLRALLGWQTALTALTWESKAFVKTCKAAEVREGATNSDLNRGINGWSAIWACEIEMFFTTSDMRPVEVEP